MRVIPMLKIPPGELLRANPALFLQVKLAGDMTKGDWHAFYDRIESEPPMLRRWRKLLNGKGGRL